MSERVDSRPETYKHIQTVQGFINKAVKNLIDRAEKHDQSKLVSPEVELFDEWTPKLGQVEYGSEEYKRCLDGLKPALDHHYANNDHHSEFFTNGIKSMGLMQMTEMLCDWLAATKRMKSGTGDIRKSIEMNQKRFGYGDEIKQLLLNSLKELE